ncbi:hypothetical protein [Stenotrophomonas sp. BIGb0135]|uniref:hypothetical protein n=1 Tax=Stenotrophomonas sp. BIGb0135 TaxID=2940620 RepID=UPI00216A6C1D|nr:hypothetical protein [Stenotrophomonas sp. BIGb0135]
MDNATRRAATRAADKFLKAAGYDAKGASLRKTAKKKCKTTRVTRQVEKARQKRGRSVC